jgi:TetR/AcrR family transcriptional regulator, transcriptional repressor for nem operon
MTRPAKRADGRDTRTQLLDVAQALAQDVGYGGFSYHDLAREVGISTASIHHHFPPKEDLGRAVMERYRARFASALAAIDATARHGTDRLQGFVDLFAATLAAGDKLCLCGMLASEHAKLPRAVQEEVRLFFRESEAWLARTLDDGRRRGEFHYAGDAAEVACTFFSALEGAMISARTFGEHRRLTNAGAQLVAMISSSSRPKRAPARRPKR